MTGEESILTMASKTGISTRTLEINSKPFDTENEASHMYDVVRYNYGIAGKTYLQKLINEYGNDFIKLYDKMLEIQSALKKLNSDKINSHISSVSIVVLADILISNWLFNEINEQGSIIMGQSILQKLSSIQDVDVIEKAYEYIEGWLLSNDAAFKDDVVYGQRYGIKKNNKYHIFPSILDKELVANKFNTRAILKGFSDRGYIEKDSAGKNQKTVRIKGNNTRVIVFNMRDDLPKSLDVKDEECPF